MGAAIGQSGTATAPGDTAIGQSGTATAPGDTAIGRSGTVAAGSGWWGWGAWRWLGLLEFVFSVGPLDDLAAVFVDILVVAVDAEQAEIVDVGGSTVGRTDDVMRLAPVVIAAAADAALVSCGEHGALAVAGVAVLASQPERLALGVEDGRQDGGFTGEAHEFLGRQLGPVGEPRVWSRPAVVS